MSTTTTERAADLPRGGLSRWATAAPFLGICRETARKLEAENRFPRRRKISKRCVAWSNHELQKWLTDPAGYRAEVSA